ncbi:hypothetical protein CPB86DRAFT_778593 [Serendipita vermifera]|nr:hypothetical protein CPB86DRAFT_778593 [Serendipita vermifera]
MLPPEIWQIILQYSILVPDFLDQNHVEDRFPIWAIDRRSWSDSAKYFNTEYFKTESTINALRRVCKAWDEYLRPYVHRFVRMSDVLHGLVPAKYLQSALRISFEGHREACCSACKPEQFSSEGVTIPQKDRYMQFKNLNRKIIQRAQPLKAEILDYGESGNGILDDLVSPRTFPKLVYIQGMSGTIYDAVEIIGSIPLLRHMFSILYFDDASRVSLKSSTLTSLALAFPNPGHPLHLFTEENIQLPALRNLHIQYIYWDRSPLDVEPEWFPLLRVIGKGLRRLYLTWHRSMPDKVPGEIWDICPKLEDLCVYWHHEILAPPPAGHPLHTLCIYHERISGTEVFLQDWPGLRTIRTEMGWDQWRKLSFRPLETSQLEWIRGRLHLEDAKGESYEEYLSRREGVIDAPEGLPWWKSSGNMNGSDSTDDLGFGLFD